MAITAQQLQAEDSAYAKQTSDAINAKQSQEALQGGQQPEPSFLQKWVTGPVGRVTTSMMDTAVSAADSFMQGPDVKHSRDIAAGAITGVVNIADAAKSALTTSGQRMAAAEDPEHADAALAPPPSSPIWDHAKGAILDFRDAIAVKDPTLVDNLTQAGAQLAIPFAGYSRALAGVHGIANTIAAGIATDATALGPHDPRLADVIALGRTAEGKLGEVLRAIAPDGGAVNAYLNYLTSGHEGATPAERAQNESEAEGRFKNVIDGFGANMIVTGLVHTAASVIKQGTAGLRYLVDKGVGSTSDLRTSIGAEPQDMSLSPEDRAARRAEVAAQRDAADPNPGSGDMPTIEPPTPYQARAEGEAVKRDKEANTPPASVLEADPAITAARTFLKSQVDAGHEGSLHAMVTTLGQHIDASTADGAFYKDILGRLSSRNLQTTITAPGAGIHPKLTDVAGNTAGKYSHVEDTMALYPTAFTNNKTLVHTVAHEAVHAATVQAINKTPAVRSALSGLMNEALANGPQGVKPAYGFKNPKEFVAEAESNPRFQQLLKNTKAADGRPVWDHYKEVIGGIFGITGVALAAPQFDKLITGEKTGA